MTKKLPKGKKMAKKKKAKKSTRRVKKKEEQKAAHVDVPKEESVSGLIRDALAVFEDAEKSEATVSKGGGGREAEAPDQTLEGEKKVEQREAPVKMGDAEKAEDVAGPPPSPPAEDERDRAGEGDSDGPPQSGTDVGEVEEVEEAEPASGMIQKTVRRKSRPETVMDAFEPTEYEILGSVIKFHCRCGKRVSAPADSKRFTGKCPKCGVRLVLPKPEERASLRAALPASWVSRLVAFQIDAAVVAALFFGLFFPLRWLDAGPVVSWVVPASAAGVGWLVVGILLPSVVSASLGMLAVGLRFRGPEGGPLSVVEAVGRGLLGLVLLPLAPLALADPKRRTTADLAMKSIVVQAGSAPDAS